MEFLAIRTATTIFAFAEALSSVESCSVLVPRFSLVEAIALLPVTPARFRRYCFQ